MKLPVFASTLFLLAVPAFGAAQNEITYEEAVAKCQEFVNDPQIVQIKFKVACFDESYDWKETERRMVQQDNSGLAGHRLVMKEKWQTPDFAIPIVRNPIQTDCPVLSRFKTSRQAELVLSCEEFVNQYSDPETLVERCNQNLAGATAQTAPTGEQVDLCASAQ